MGQVAFTEVRVVRVGLLLGVDILVGVDKLNGCLCVSASAYQTVHFAIA